MFSLLATASATNTVYLAINVIGEGSATVTIFAPPPNGSIVTLNLTHSVTLKVPESSIVTVKSSEPFWLGQGTMVTKYFEQVVSRNTTWDVYFNPSNVVYSPSYYKVISVELSNIKSVNISIVNQTTIFTTLQLNKTTNLFIPKTTTELIFVSFQNFSVNGASAIYGRYGYDLYVNANVSTFVVSGVSNLTTALTTTTTPATSTLPPVSVTTTTALQNSTTTARSPPAGYYYILAVVVIVLVVLFVLSKVRK